MKQGRSWVWTAAAIVVLGGLARIPGLFTDFWLDEIWSYTYVQKLSSPMEVFTAVHHDSNHWLNSLALYGLGGGRPFWQYRLVSFLAGVAAIAAAGFAGALQLEEGRRRAGCLIAMALTASSFPLVFYSTEARGYSLAVLWALCAFVFFLLYLEKGGWIWRLGYWLTAVLGLLSHLSFLTVYVASLAYSLVLRARGHRFARGVAVMHGPPLVILLILFWIDLRHMTFGGGPEYRPYHLLVETGSLSVGGAANGWAGWGAAAFAATLFFLDLTQRVRRYRAGDGGSEVRSLLWVFFAVAVVGFPLWLMWILRPPFLFPRYFVVCIALFQIALAGLFARLVEIPGWGRGLAVILALLLLSMNLTQWIEFNALGRGHYRAALEYMLRCSEEPPVTIGGDHDFRNQMIIDFYKSYLGEGADSVVYFSRVWWPSSGTQWWIAESQAPRFQPQPTVCDHVGLVYHLEAIYRSSHLSGMSWFVYRRQRTEESLLSSEYGKK